MMAIKTLSLCALCYKKIPAEITFQNGMVVMNKVCDVHGLTTAVVEKDIQHFARFYELGTLDKNNSIIIHAHNQCNMKCEWCYYPMGVEPMHDAEYYNNALKSFPIETPYVPDGNIHTYHLYVLRARQELEKLKS